ncbi:MAG: hypothetical protein ABW252_04335 [Polyangiales bacterium]
MSTHGVVPELFDVQLQAPNLEELGQFYQRLGLRKAVDDDDVKVFILGVNELEIHRQAAASRDPQTIRVRVPQLGTIEQTLQQHAIGYQGPEAGDDGLAVIVRDPNGNVVSFVETRH